METARCPPGWLANERSCFTVRRTGLRWSEAQQSCKHLAAGSHLADLKTLDDLLFVSSHLVSHNNLLLLWTGLNDQQEEGQPLWSDGSSHNLTNNIGTLLPASVTDCFALQRNATGPGYFLTPFFCNIPLPFICQYQNPPVPSSFSFDLVQVTEEHVELRWSDLSTLNSVKHSLFEIFLQYQEETNKELDQGEEDRRRDSDVSKRIQSQSTIKRIVKVPISTSSRGVTVAGLSPGSIYTFTLQACHPAGSTWSLGQTRTAYTRPLTPQNITVGPVTISQISVHWILPETHHAAAWTFVVRYVDMSSSQERIVRMVNISRPSETGRLQSHTAVIGELESYRKYLVEVYTVTQHGVESCGHVPLTVQTGLAPPSRVREGLVTDSSIELLWDPAKGQAHSYEVICLNCDHSHMVQKVLSQSAVFSSLTPGRLYHFAVRTEKESFPDSSSVTINITAVPDVPQEVALSEQVVTSVFVTWRPPPGQVEAYKLVFGLLAVDRKLWNEVLVKSTSYEIRDLIPGSDYGLSIQSVLGSDTSLAVYREFSTRPAGLCSLHLDYVNSSSVSVSWDRVFGEFDFHRVIVANASVTNTLIVPKEEEVAVVTGLVDGCSYNMSAERADVVSVSSGTQYTVTVTAASSSNISPGVSRMITTNESVPGPPTNLEGEAVGSNGILLSWTMPPNAGNNIEYAIRYREVCPYPDVTFTKVIKILEIPETLLTDFISGSTYLIQVAAISSAGEGAFSKALYIKTNESPPGLVTNLTAFAQNHTFVMVNWFLPHRIHGLITKFAVKAKHARTGQTVRTLEVNAEAIMTGALPHCNDAADILSRATLSPLEITASSPPITLSAVPPAASWSVPISVGVDQLRPYTAYLFEVSAFTSDGEGQIASTMVRMPESAPEDPPQDILILNMTSRSIFVSWKSPVIITGKFTYVLSLYGPAGYLYDNNTANMQFAFSDLTPYTRYTVAVQAKAAGEVGPAAQRTVITPAEAPSAVQDLMAVAEDSVSIRVSWRSPAQPNGPIIHYKLLVMSDDTLLQDITLTADNKTLYKDAALTHEALNGRGRRKRTADLSWITSPPAFTASVSDHTLPTGIAASSFIGSDYITNTIIQPATETVVTEKPSYTSASHSNSTDIQSPDSAVYRTSAFSLTSASHATVPPWLTKQSNSGDMTSDSTPLTLTPGQHRFSTSDAITEPITRTATSSGTTGVTVKEEVMDVLSADLTYLVSDLDPFTEYTFRVTASTTVGEGPATHITEKTREQVPSSVLEVSYQNISSTSILVTWSPPLQPNGRIIHYTVYCLKVHSTEALKRVTNATRILITDLDKYTGYKLRVAASTAAGESSLSEEDDMFVFTLEDEPDSPPVNLTVVDTSPSTTTLAWSPPEKANGIIQHYEVLYENESFSALMNTSTNKVILMNLKPFSYYNVSVRAYTRYGDGNQTSDTLYLLSGEDVPGSPPYGLSYESVSPSEVNVTWQPPLLPNGVITHYSLELWNSSHHLNLTSATNSIHIMHLRKYAHYRVMVQTHTRVGPGNYSSEPLNITTLEDAPETPPQFLHARKLSDYEVGLSWQPPLSANSDILYYIVTVWNETSELRQNVTETSVVVNVDSDSYYNASVSSWTRLGDGGVLIYISFTSAFAEPFEPPQNVTVVNVTASSLTLLWYPPTQPNGIIVHYSIYYTHNKTLIEQRVPISHFPTPASPDSPLSYTLTWLIAGSNYTIWMTSSTVKGDGGVQSEPLIVFLPEDVPSDSVRNLTARIYSSTAIVISWEPPLEPNGSPYYVLTLQETGPLQNVSNQGAPAVNNIINSTTTDNIYLFTKLKKYFPYVLTVTPATSAGLATNHTSTVYLRTDDDIPSSAPLLVSTRNFSSSSIAVVWQRPLEANGEITEYTLTLFGPGGFNITYSPNTSFIFTDLLPYTAYNLTITASTRKGAGPYLLLQLHTDEGVPTSPPQNLTIHNHTAVSVVAVLGASSGAKWEYTTYEFLWSFSIPVTFTTNESEGKTGTYFYIHIFFYFYIFSKIKILHILQYNSGKLITETELVSDAVGNLTCSAVSWDSVYLFWEYPANTNGKIHYYEIIVKIHTKSQNYKVNSLEYTVTGLSPDKEYVINVAAVNSAGAGDGVNCTAITHSESVPPAPRFLTISHVTPNNMTLQWAPPLPVPGLLKEYRIIVQLLSVACEKGSLLTALPAPEDELPSDCVDFNYTVVVNPLNGSKENHSFTLQFLAKYRYYRFKVAAVTNAGVGEYTRWNYARTLAGNPDAPPRDVTAMPTSNSLHIEWKAPAVLSGPTSYLVQVTSVAGPDLNFSTVPPPGELTTDVHNLTAFTHYFVTITAFTGPLEHATSEGKSIGPLEFQTMEEEPKDPPKNVTISVIPEEETHLKVTFTPPDTPNGKITAYYVYIYEKGQLVKNTSLNITQKDQNTLTAVIEGLKGGRNYSIQISAKNGAGRSPPSTHIQITTGIKAPARPEQKPQALLGYGGVATVTHSSITIPTPACFFSDDNGPIAIIQVIVAESDVKDKENLTNWRGAFFDRPAPYLTDKGFSNPPCFLRDGASSTDADIRIGRSVPPVSHKRTGTETYVIGENNDCMVENSTDNFCNGPLKPNTAYVFKFRATNIKGQYTDSLYSDNIKTAVVDRLLTRKEQLILGVLLSFFLSVLVIIIICASVKIHQRKKEGGTYSPREAEIIETKCKLDQLIAVADLELKQEKLNRYSSFFFRRKEIYVIQLLSYRKSLKPVNKKTFLQHVEDLCANDNAKFQEEFAELPKLLPDLATTDADLPWNKSKNRFPNIKPYNNNRVKLLSEPGTAGSDYINASFISGYLCPNEFIATQGPLPGTVADFWRMIWETRTHTIAMLTQCYEKGRIRCQKYWPEDNKPMTVFSDILISKVSEEVLPDWTVRTLRVEKHGQYILVRHFNYTSWPEHGVPESCSTLIKFVKAVRAHRHNNSTIVVHCSAGVGRTGVFIALDHLIQHVRDHDFVDIYGLVAELRSERMCMVQNLAQYIFLHQSTLELLNNKGNSQSIWFVSYSALEKMDSLEAMEGDVELEWEETTM
ncbi:Phosphatidylinositol phosphatase PTPRQ [Channa argus]|uniref:Phosphatidylinositol phosphatase PTPRQ n=1 Tax=Channa argus TaxID=215402 RepID=A0A6G1PF52_CHAAH|nr:Phosphatidylinositol phosphatase PTPRQ [Channa argus]